MAGQFFDRLRDYFEQVAAALRDEASAASIFPNSTDIGSTRERIYLDFLRQHTPPKCTTFLGGFVFGNDGEESDQLDVIVTTDTTPRYNLPNKNNEGKSFSPVEGTIAVASIKSTLNKNELENALKGISTIPRTKPLEPSRIPPNLKIPDYDDWPFKIIFASNGIDVEALIGHLNSYYLTNSNIPFCRRPNVIHVAGKYTIVRGKRPMVLHDFTTNSDRVVPDGGFEFFTRKPDLMGISMVLHEVQRRATLSAQILYSYGHIYNQLLGIPPEN